MMASWQRIVPKSIDPGFITNATIQSKCRGTVVGIVEHQVNKAVKRSDDPPLQGVNKKKVISDLLKERDRLRSRARLAEQELELEIQRQNRHDVNPLTWGHNLRTQDPSNSAKNKTQKRHKRRNIRRARKPKTTSTPATPATKRPQGFRDTLINNAAQTLSTPPPPRNLASNFSKTE